VRAGRAAREQEHVLVAQRLERQQQAVALARRPVDVRRLGSERPISIAAQRVPAGTTSAPSERRCAIGAAARRAARPPPSRAARGRPGAAGRRGRRRGGAAGRRGRRRGGAPEPPLPSRSKRALFKLGEGISLQLQWLCAHGADWDESSTCAPAARRGQLAVLRWPLGARPDAPGSRIGCSTRRAGGARPSSRTTATRSRRRAGSSPAPPSRTRSRHGATRGLRRSRAFSERAAHRHSKGTLFFSRWKPGLHRRARRAPQSPSEHPGSSGARDSPARAQMGQRTKPGSGAAPLVRLRIWPCL
jgi:hypothetical protein